jgi:hypothetical protein
VTLTALISTGSDRMIYNRMIYLGQQVIAELNNVNQSEGRMCEEVSTDTISPATCLLGRDGLSWRVNLRQVIRPSVMPDKKMEEMGRYRSVYAMEP